MTDDLFEIIDRMDAPGFASRFAQDGRFRFANMPQICGRGCVQEFVAGFFSSIAGLSHTVRRSWDTADGVVCHGDVTYTRKDGSTLTVPFAVIYTADDDGIRDYRIFMDASAL
ncbi:MAG: nuclear transport factor 2 family protein [Chromatiales bacterium]|nr:nuclear transport factor 2 family protein [Chromatiales bacterium]